MAKPRGVANSSFTIGAEIPEHAGSIIEWVNPSSQGPLVSPVFIHFGKVNPTLFDLRDPTCRGQHLMPLIRQIAPLDPARSDQIKKASRPVNCVGGQCGTAESAGSTPVSIVQFLRVFIFQTRCIVFLMIKTALHIPTRGASNALPMLGLLLLSHL